MLCYAMTISGIQTHYLRCPPVSTIHPLKGPLVLFQKKLALSSYTLSSGPSTTITSCRLTDQSLMDTPKIIVPVSSPALKSIYGPVVYLFGYSTFPISDYRPGALPPASRADSPALLMISHAHDLYIKYDMYACDG
jgi:hypothetical protein